MSDEKIINFKELQDKVTDGDIDKFEQYIFSLSNDYRTGSLDMISFSRKVTEYMKENNISNEKFINIQKKMMERYGFDPEYIDEELRKMGVDPSNLENMESGHMDSRLEKDISEIINKYDEVKKNIVKEFSFKNDKNDVKFIFEEDRVIIISEKRIDLSDSEINGIVAQYRLLVDHPIKVMICESSNTYDYF